MSEIAKTFLDSEKLAKRKTKSSTGISCLGIPAGFADDFINQISSQCSPQNKPESTEVSRLLNHSSIARKKLNDEYFFCWRDLALEKFKDAALADPRTRIFDCIMAGVQVFLENNLANIPPSETKIRSLHGGRSTFGIPSSLITQFYDWYQMNLLRGFKEYDMDQPSESLKHTLEPTSPRPKKATKFLALVSDENEPNFENLINQFPIEPSPFAIEPFHEEYFSSNVLSNMDMVFPGNDTEKENLALYTEYYLNGV